MPADYGSVSCDLLRDRRPHAGDPEAPEPCIELLAVYGVSVVNQVTRLATPRRGMIISCQIQAAVGLAVTSKWTTSRRAWVMKKARYAEG
jgi:hypothetical protein